MSWVHAGSSGLEGLLTIVIIVFWVVSRILGAAAKKGGPAPMPRSMPPDAEPPPPPGPSPEDELRRFLEDLTGAELPPQVPPPVAEPTGAEPVAEAPAPPPVQARRRRHRRSPFTPPAIPAVAPAAAPAAPAARWYEEAAPGGVPASPPATVLPRPRVSLNAFSIPGIKLPSLRWGSVGSQSTGNAAAGADSGRRRRGLSCPGGLRNAVVLRTILGPPRALAEVRPDGSHDD